MTDYTELRTKALAVNHALLTGAPAHAADVFLTDADEDYYSAATPRVVLELLDRLETAERELQLRELHHFETEKAMVEALNHLHVAEAADFDILNGRKVMDATEERSASIHMAVEVLERATGYTNGKRR